ncbi:MAG: helix-turn-helix transcriptional regulator [Bryobacteraceae bacterium]|nr:helix-turn-helix transcriptional regulator [Bryobacteraceae bacterium]
MNDLTQREIARQLGISNPYLTMILRGQRPAVHIREQLVDLGMPVDLVELPGAQDMPVELGVRPGAKQQRAA